LFLQLGKLGLFLGIVKDAPEGAGFFLARLAVDRSSLALHTPFQNEPLRRQEREE
jgi:hypothetical protein